MRNLAKKVCSSLLLMGGLFLPLTVVKAQNITNSTFKPHGKLFAQFFGDYYYQMGGETNPSLPSHAQYANTAKDMNAFDIRRVYFGYTYNFTPDISTKIELAHEGDFLPDGNRGFYLKNADIQIKNVVPYGKLIIGQQATPTFATFTEHVWGYRSVEKTLLDMRHFASSNDLGVALTGDFNSQGTLSYTLMVGNGNGAKAPTKYKRVYGEIHAKLLNKKLLLEAYADYQSASNGMDKTTFKGFVGYQTKALTLGLAGVQQLQKKAVSLNNQLVDGTASGLWVFAHGSLIPGKLNGFARQDFYNPDSKHKTGYKEYFTLLGLDYLVSSHVHLMPNIWINSFSPQGSLQNHNSDVVARVTWYFSF